MRFRDILKELELCEPKLKIEKEHVSNNAYSILNFSELIQTLIKLYDFEFLEQYIAPIAKKPYFSETFGGPINLASNEVTDLDFVVKNTLHAVDVCIDLLDSNIDKQDPHTISFKLHEIDTFEEYYQFNDDLSKKILYPLTYCGITIKMGDLEEGSRWQSIIVGSVAGLMLLTAIFRQSADIIIHDVNRIRITNDLISVYEKNNENIDTLNKMIKKMEEDELTSRAEKAIEELNTELENLSEDERTTIEKVLVDKQKRNELINAIQFSIQKTNEYIDKGLEIYQALNVPENTRYQLPNFKELLSMNPQKFLIENTDSIGTDDQ